ncbi:hypothetical protein KIW84_020085 [Lathyrus oleraceus]|uniref:Reverse transcriptase n=1 Tax=Pisum sativum TaxID=3888 RepID=A0A9D4Y4F4_PEA|nr:hypothetical protein KIW84_020085 [Pisum sativum]
MSDPNQRGSPRKRMRLEAITLQGAHEYNGSHSPARGLMEDFGRWTDSNHLLHIPTTGARFTWSNSRMSVSHAQKRLDRAVCNQDWMDSWIGLNLGNVSCFGNVKVKVNQDEKDLKDIQDKIVMVGHSNILVALERKAHVSLVQALIIEEMFSRVQWHAMGDRNTRHSMLANKIGFLVGQLPFTYLGVPIFKGRPKVAYFLPTVDKVKCKLAAWKASLLSIAGII